MIGPIGKRDSLLMQSMEDDMSQVILDYLGVESEEDVSKEHVEELLEIRKFLETSEGGKGTLSSPHFEVLYNSKCWQMRSFRRSFARKKN